MNNIKLPWSPSAYQLSIPYGFGSVTVEILTKNIKIIKPKEIPKVFLEKIAIQKGLLNLICSKRLSELVSGCKGCKVAIIVSDITHPIPL